MIKKYMFLILSLACLLFGCGSTSGEIGNNSEEIGNTSEVVDVDENSEASITDECKIIVVASNDFLDERAWIEYSVEKTEEVTEYIGCIDKKGIVLFQYLKNSINKYTNYEKGSAYIEFNDGSMQIIDMFGKPVRSMKKEEIGTFQFSGDGYYCFIRQYSGFDKSGIVTTIIDGKGNVLYEGENGFTAYCGDNMFVSYNPLKGTHYKYYNIADNTYFECDDVSPNNKSTVFDNGYSAIHLGKSGRIGDSRYAIISTSGNIEEFFKGNTAYNESVGDVKNGVVVFDEYANNPSSAFGGKVQKLGYYDVQNKTYMYLEKYLDKMYGEYLIKDILCFSNDRIVLPLMGADYKIYIAIFDKQWNEILEPTLFAGDIRNCKYSCNRLVINFGNGDIVLDENGEIVFEANSCGYKYISTYSNDVAKVGVGAYVDKMGNLLFEKIIIK